MFTKKGQSILEYSILLAVVIAVLLIMQAYVKRGYSGSLKGAADRMGDGFSASGTTIKEEQSMTGDQNIVTEVGTTAAIMGGFAGQVPSGVNVTGALDSSAYSLNTKKGGVVKSETQTKTDAAAQEKARLADYDTTAVTNFTDPDLPQ
jgi:hypothetical protein